MKAVIIAHGNIKDYNYFSGIIRQADFIICADGGGSHLKKMEILPDIIVGDFDSLSRRDYDFYKKNNIEIIRHPSEKDATDTELAVDLAIEKKCDDITILGATGTRLDHTLANIFLLKKITEISAQKKINCRIIDDKNEIFLVSDSITIKQTEGCFISLLPLGESVDGVTTKGLKYPLSNACIKCGSSIGISNQIIEDKASISLKKGTLIVLKSKD